MIIALLHDTVGPAHLGFGNEFSDKTVLRLIFHPRKHVARTRMK